MTYLPCASPVVTLFRKSRPNLWWWLAQLWVTVLYSAILLSLRLRAEPRLSPNINYQPWNLLKCDQIPTSLYLPQYTIINLGPMAINRKIFAGAYKIIESGDVLQDTALVGLSDLGISMTSEHTETPNHTLNYVTVAAFPGSFEPRKFSPLRVEPKAYLFSDSWSSFIAQREELHNYFLCIVTQIMTYPNLRNKINITVEEMPSKEGEFDPFYKVMIVSLPLIVTGSVLAIAVSLVIAISSEEKNRTYLILKTVGYWRIWNTYTHIIMHTVQALIIISILFFPLWLAEIYFNYNRVPPMRTNLDVVTLWAISLIYGGCLIAMCAFYTIAFHPKGHSFFIIVTMLQPLAVTVIGSTSFGCSPFVVWILPFFIPVMAFHNAIIDQSSSFQGQGGYQDCVNLSLLEYFELYGEKIRPTVYYLLGNWLMYTILLSGLEVLYAFKDFKFETGACEREQRMIWVISQRSRPNLRPESFYEPRRKSSIVTGRRGRSRMFKEMNIQPVDDEQELTAVMIEVSLQWYGFRVMDRFSMTLQEEIVTGLISTSPCFFSAFISILTSATRSYTGTIHIFEQEGVIKPALQVSVCTAEPILFEHLSVIENFHLLSRQPNPDLNMIFQALMARIGLLHLIANKVKTLTKGQRKLIAIAIALSGTSRVAILEEPLRGLQMEDIPKVLHLIYIGKSRRSVVILTSSPKLADTLSQRIALESRGRVMIEGTASFLKRKFRLDFSLHITKSSYFRFSDVHDILEDLTGPVVATRGDLVNTKILFHLSRPVLSKVEAINDLLTANMKGLKIYRFALAETNLEDIFHVLENPMDLRRTEDDGSGNQFQNQSDNLRRWLSLHRCNPRPRFAYQHFLVVFLLCVCHLWLRMTRAKVSRAMLFLLIGLAVCYCFAKLGQVLPDVFNPNIYPHTTYCSAGSPDLLQKFASHMDNIPQAPWMANESFKQRRQKYKFCINASTQSDASDHITVYEHPNDPGWLERVVPTIVNIGLEKQEGETRYKLIVHEPMLDRIRIYLTWVPDSHYVYNMLVISVLIVNSFYFVFINHTSFITRHLFQSGLPKMAHFLALYATLFAINFVAVIAFIVAPLYITSSLPSALFLYKTSYRPHPSDFFLLTLICSSHFTLFSIAVGLWLPKSVSFLHVLVYMFCTKTMIAALLLYHVPIEDRLLWLLSLLSPGNIGGIFAHLVQRKEKINRVCFHELIWELACVYNPYSVRPCCEQAYDCDWKDQHGNLCPGSIFTYAVWSTILPQLIFIASIFAWYDGPCLGIRCFRKQKRSKESSELTRVPNEMLSSELVLTKHNLHETLLRENAQLKKGVVERLLKSGSIVMKDARLEAESTKRPINLVIYPNSCCGVLGLSRSGKSIFLKIIRGERKVQLGEVHVNGLLNCDPSRIGYYSKSIEFPGVLQPIELFLVQATIRKQPYGYRKEAVLALAAIFGLVDKLEEKLSSLSNGDRRLVSLMSAFVGKPEIVLLDEPTAEVDSTTREAIWNAISLLKQSCTLVIATDTLDDYERIGFDKVVVMANRDIKMILLQRELEAHVYKGYSLIVKVHVTSDSDPELHQSFSHNSSGHSRSPMGPIREWILLRLPKAVPAIDAGGLLEMHVIGESTSIDELFKLREFLCKQFSYISEFRITHLSNRDRLCHLISLANKYSTTPRSPDTSSATLENSFGNYAGYP